MKSKPYGESTTFVLSRASETAAIVVSAHLKLATDELPRVNSFDAQASDADAPYPIIVLFCPVVKLLPHEAPIIVLS